MKSLMPFGRAAATSRPGVLGVLSVLVLAAASPAQKPARPAGPTIQDAYQAHGPDLMVYDEHLTFLASPFLDGRLPGTRGMEIAKDYVQHFYLKAGLEPAFEDGKSWRQPFPLRGVIGVKTARLVLAGDTLQKGTDYNVLGLGQGGKAKSQLVFVGYAIENRGAADGGEYESFAKEDDLSGKIAICLRFEPMDANGRSLWASQRRPWSPHASFTRKMQVLTKRGVAGVIFVNAPGADDPRAHELMEEASGGIGREALPVVMLSSARADALVRAHDPEKRSLLALRKLADEGRCVVPLDAEAELETELTRVGTSGENVGGLLRGKGKLADELIVIGGHLDHLGMGQFGSRSGGGELHPGADDNASGVAGILLMAERLAAKYRQLPEDAEARSLLFLAFSGEESGLNGSRYYTRNPIRPLAQHALMMNFDMIGRITGGRLSVSGTGSAKGMEEWLTPILDRSPLEIRSGNSMMGGSDHRSFYSARVPILFAIITPFHGDYHTPRDTADKINRVDAVHAVRLWIDIAETAALRNEPFEFDTPTQTGPATSDRPRVLRSKVRFGIMPGNYEERGSGVLVDSVSPGGSADKGGIEAGDRMTKWNDKELGSVVEWMVLLAQHSPGDKVKVTVVREGKEKELTIELQAR